MSALHHHARVLRYAALSGFQDFGYTYTVWSWGFGLFLRMMAQVAFFASIGRLLGSKDQVAYLLVGNAVMAAAAGCLTAAVATTWERNAGTLPLPVASPTSPLVVLMGRSVFFVANGLAFSVGALVLVPPLFDVTLPWGPVPGGGRPRRPRQRHHLFRRHLPRGSRPGRHRCPPDGGGWLLLSLATFHRLAESGRRDGSIVFSSA